MAVEIERKFLVTGNGWRQEVCRSIVMRQRYLPFDGENHASGRIRFAEGKAYLTLKTGQTGFSRSEFEYELPVSDAETIYQKICAGSAIEKTRHLIRDGIFTWEIDEFSGDNAGLTVAEIELESPDQQFPHPVWLGREVTGDHRYANSALVKNPYSRWKD